MSHSRCAVCDKCQKHTSIDDEFFSYNWYTLELPGNLKDHPPVRKTVHFCSYICLVEFMEADKNG